MNIANKAVLITGANRGIGRALVDEALKRGASRVYAGTRGTLENADKRVTALTLDVTSASQILRAVQEVESLDVLINNAGIAIYDDLSNLDVIEQHLAVNLLGPLKVAQAFLPLLRRSKGAIVNSLSMASLAPLPVIPAYSLSKSAAFNMTQSLRAHLAGQGVTVHAVVLGPVDTDMNKGFDIPKASPESAAARIFDGLEKGSCRLKARRRRARITNTIWRRRRISDGLDFLRPQRFCLQPRRTRYFGRWSDPFRLGNYPLQGQPENPI